MNPRRYIIYTDGSYRKPNLGKPAAGAYAAIIIDAKLKHSVINGVEKDTTISRMELLAVISALESIKEPSICTINSDSQYVVNSMSKWLRLWKKHNYKNWKGESIKNVDLMERLHDQIVRHTVTAIWVRAHNNDFYNEQCDLIVTRMTYLMTNGQDWKTDVLLNRLIKAISARRTMN